MDSFGVGKKSPIWGGIVGTLSAQTDLITKLGQMLIPGGRLTLTTAVPVTTADVSGASARTIYYTPYKHNQINLWDGTYWQPTTFSEVSLALGTLTAARPYDVFGYLNSGSLALEFLVWTSATARATAITIQDGRYCKSGDKTRLYLGTFYTVNTTDTEDSGGGVTTQVGGKRFLWNMYNRVARYMAVIDTSDNWSYTTDTIRQSNAAAGNMVECVIGLAEDEVLVRAMSVINLITNTARAAKVGVGVDATNAFSGIRQGGYNTGVSGYHPASGEYYGIPVAGYHYFAWCEKGSDGTCQFLGDNGADGQQTGMTARMWA